MRTALGIGLALAVLAAAAPPGAAAPGDYLGSEACGACHPRELARWKAGPHARAGSVLSGGQQGVCLSCHTTGDAPVGPVIERRVGCESCHGPGRSYGPEDVMQNPVLARALGLTELDNPEVRRAICKSCHRVQTRIGPRDFEARWRDVGHGGSP